MSVAITPAAAGTVAFEDALVIDAMGPVVSPASDLSVSIIIPTFNEAGNILELLGRIALAMDAADWNIVVVDDNSSDGTAELVQSVAQFEPRVQCLQRVGRRGLSSACLEGMALAKGSFLAVIDADLQHDERLLPTMFTLLKSKRVDLVVGSRYTSSGSIGSWSRTRSLLSRFATRVTRSLLDIELSDPMSGFFMIRREVVAMAAARLSDSGFKLLLDLVANSPAALRVVVTLPPKNVVLS